MSRIHTTSLLDLIPANLRSDIQIQAAALALDKELAAVTSGIDESIIVARIGELPEDVVDLLAWQWHVDFYEYSLDIATKRKLVRNSIDWHRRQGTVGVVQEQVSSIFTNGKVVEWWEYQGEPYHFRVECSNNIQDTASFDELVRLINIVKNVRSWLDGIRINREIHARYYIGQAWRTGKTALVNIDGKFTIQPVKYTNYYALACRTASREVIKAVMD